MAIGARQPAPRRRRLARHVRICGRGDAATEQWTPRLARHPDAFRDGDDAAIEARNREIEELAASGRYPSGSYLPALARGFAAFERRDFAATIEALAPIAGQNERIGGSRAQHDLIEFTLLKAYLGAARLEEAKRLLRARRPGASGVPVAGIAAVQ